MNEIGGYFGLEELIHNEYYPNLVAVNTARNALLYLVKAKGIRESLTLGGAALVSDKTVRIIVPQ